MHIIKEMSYFLKIIFHVIIGLMWSQVYIKFSLPITTSPPKCSQFF